MPRLSDAYFAWLAKYEATYFACPYFAHNPPDPVMQSMYLFAKYGVHTLHVVHTLHETESGKCKLWMQSMEAAGSQQTSHWSAAIEARR